MMNSFHIIMTEDESILDDANTFAVRKQFKPVNRHPYRSKNKAPNQFILRVTVSAFK